MTSLQEIQDRLGLAPAGLGPLGTEVSGQTPEGRNIYKNPDGSFSSERSITEQHPGLNEGRWTNLPSIYGGQELSADEAIGRVIEAGGRDPETGRELPGFDTREAAIAAAKARSDQIPRSAPTLEDIQRRLSGTPAAPSPPPERSRQRPSPTTGLPESPQSVAQSSLHGIAQGAAGGVAGFPESYARQRQAGYRWRQEQFDKIDRGERPDARAMEQFHVQEYYRGDEVKRQELRQAVDVKPIEEEPAYQLGERIRRGTAEALPIPAEHEERFPVQVGKGIGSTAVFLGTGLAGRAARLPAAATAAGAGATVNSAATFRDAISSGASFEDASTAANMAGLVGTTEAMPIARVFDRFDKASGHKIRRWITDAIKGGGEEMAQEVTQTIAENLIASNLVGYDKERETFTGTGESAGVGFTVGSLFNFVASVLGGRRRGGIEAPAAPTEPAPPSATETTPAPETATTPAPEPPAAPPAPPPTPSGETKTDVESRPLEDVIASIEEEIEGETAPAKAPTLENIEHRIRESERKGIPAGKPATVGEVYVKPIKAFHGSPHDFEKFDVAQIGTGEGAQAFGRGLYFAEQREVAKSYQASLGMNQIGALDAALPDYFKPGSVVPGYAGYDKVLDFKQRGPGDFSVRVIRVKKDGSPIPGEKPRQHATLPTAENFERVLGRVPGRLYEVNINAKRDEFLDWDKPMSEQPAAMSFIDAMEADALRKKNTTQAGHWAHRRQSKGVELLNYLEHVLGSKDAASNALRKAGIKGIRYLDQGSRAEGRGSYNYVVFDDSAVQITKKDGTPVTPKERRDYLSRLIRESERKGVPKGRPAQKGLAYEPYKPEKVDKRTIRGRPKTTRGPITLSEFLAKRGGVKDETGELKGMDAHLWHTEKAFRPKLVRDSGVSPDYAREAAVQAGYLPSDSTVADLYDALDKDLRGRGLLTAEEMETEVTEGQNRDAMEAEALDLGINPKAVSDDDLAVQINQERVNQKDADALEDEVDRITREVLAEEPSLTQEDLGADFIPFPESRAQPAPVEEAPSALAPARPETGEPREAEEGREAPEAGDRVAEVDSTLAELREVTVEFNKPRVTRKRKAELIERAKALRAEARQKGFSSEDIQRAEFGGKTSQEIAEDALSTELTDQGPQTVIPGAERISDRDLAERGMEGRKKATKTQKEADEGLFDVEGRKQQDLLDQIPPQKPTAEPVPDIPTEPLNRPPGGFAYTIVTRGLTDGVTPLKVRGKRLTDLTNSKLEAIEKALLTSREPSAEDDLKAVQWERERRGPVKIREEKPKPTADERVPSGPSKLYTFPGPLADIAKPVTEAYQKRADQVLDAMAAGSERLGLGGWPFRDAAIGSLPERDSYLTERGLAKGKVFRVNEVARHFNDMMRKGDKDSQKAAFVYLTTKDADPKRIADRKVRNAAIAAKSTIKKIGREMVRRGLLSMESYEEHHDAYLPRLYLKHLLARGEFGSGLRTSPMAYLKQRKDLDTELREVILGQVEDPGFLTATAISLPSRDLAILDFLRVVSQNPDWTLQQSLVSYRNLQVTPFWLKSEAVRLRDLALRLEEGRATRAREIAVEMDRLADQTLQARGAVPDDYLELPDSPRYGELRGLVVRKEVFNDIVGAHKIWIGDQPLYDKVFSKLGTFNAFWKMMKVPLNPPTQVRNFVSNSVLLNISGVDAAKLPGLYMQALKEIHKNGKHARIAKKYGIQASTFTAEEVYKLRPDLLRVKGQKAGMMGKMYAIAEPLSRVTSKASDLYQFLETWGKVVKIIDEMNKGATEEQAVIEANKALFDYSLVPGPVRSLRTQPIGAPFITFYYKAAPQIIEAVMKRPGRIAPYLIIPYVLSDVLIASLHDVDEEDVDKLREALPKWLRERGHTYIFPTKGADGRWVPVDYGYFLPWAIHWQTSKSIATGQVGEAFTELGVLGGPVPQIGSALMTNIDPWTERPVINEKDPPDKQIFDLVNYAWRMGAPTWLTDRGVTGHLYRSMTNTPNYYGDAPLSVPQAAARAIGVNIYPMDPVESRRRNLSRMSFEISSLKSHAQRQMKNKSLSQSDREELRDKYRDQVERLTRELQKYRDASEVHPNLR